MIRIFRLILPMSLALAFLSGAQVRAQGSIPKAEIYKSSDWDFTLDGGQKAGVRIREGRVYPGDKRLTNQVGSFDFDGDAMYFEFVNHPKISNAEARLTKVAAGKWEGTVVDRSGQERRIVMTRR